MSNSSTWRLVGPAEFVGRGRTRTTVIRVAVVAVLAIIAAALLVPRHAQASRSGMYAVCPDPVNEGDSARMGIRRSGHRILSWAAFTYNGDHTADADDYTEYHGEGFEQSEGRTLWVPVEATEDNRPEHDETFEIGFWNGEEWNGCVVTILDDDEPRIVGVRLSSSPVDGWAYRAGESIDVIVSLDKEAEVSGSPLLSLYLGESGSSSWRGARYHSGSGTRDLVFRYVVQPEDLDVDGIAVAHARTDDAGTLTSGFSGAIYADGTDVPIDYNHSGIDPATEHRVDGRPYVQSTRIISSPEAGMDTYRANEIIQVAFTYNTRVVVEGDVCAHLLLGLRGKDTLSAKRRAPYRGGSGTDTLVFGYTVRPGDKDDKGIMVSPVNDRFSPCGSGTIKADGTDVDHNPSVDGTGHQSGHKVDTRSPAVSSVAITSQPANGKAYTAGETITVEATFDEQVTARGAPYLELDIGGGTRRAVLVADQGRVYSLAFEYAVQLGDADTDGIGIGANSVRLNDGSIRDRAGNNARLAHDAVAADASQRVAASAAH